MYFCKDRAHFLTLIVVLLNTVFIGILSKAVKNNYRLKTSLFVLVEIRSVTQAPIHTCPMKTWWIENGYFHYLCLASRKTILRTISAMAA